MKTVTLYTTDTCPYCRSAKALLASKGISMKEISIQTRPARRAEMIRRTGRRTVPQIFVGDSYIGGYDELVKLDRQHRLTSMLA